MLHLLLIVLVVLTACNAFMVRNINMQRTNVNLLMTADGEITPTPESPLVDRALDSALDFLQDGEAEEEAEVDEFEMFDIFDDSPDFEINYDLISEYEKKDADKLANKGQTAAEAHAADIQAAVDRWRKHDKDVGSAEVQIAISDVRIKYLTAHLLANKKDKATKRGLIALVTQRKKFLKYLFRTNPTKANEMVQELGLRYRGGDATTDKTVKYGAYKNTKSKWQKIRADQRAERLARQSASA